MRTRRHNRNRKSAATATATAAAVAVFSTDEVVGEAVATTAGPNTILKATFMALPSGPHGFHIHSAGDLRGKGCVGACSHWNKGRPTNHGGPPGHPGQRHTGDLGNIELSPGKKSVTYTYTLNAVSPAELWGRTLIIHADPDDLGQGPHEDSLTTGHSGKRIACALFGRM